MAAWDTARLWVCGIDCRNYFGAAVIETRESSIRASFSHLEQHIRRHKHSSAHCTHNHTKRTRQHNKLGDYLRQACPNIEPLYSSLEESIQIRGSYVG